jgi:protein-disulfide isomerase
MKSRKSFSTLGRLAPSLAMVAALVVFAGGAASGDDQGPSTVVAEVGGHKITLGQVEEHAGDNLNHARSEVLHSQLQYYDAEHSALEKEIDKELLTQEAAKSHITGDQLLKREATARVKEPGEETLRFYYLGIPNPKDSYEALRPKIITSIRALQERQFAEDYIKSLRAKQTIKIELLPPHNDVAVGEAAVGPEQAPVTVVEFADYQCPYCRQEEPTMKRVREQFKDKIKYSYRDFPLPMHPFAQKAAEASRCAGEQGQYWQYHDHLFANADLGVPVLKSTARDLKLDGDKFDKCLDSAEKAEAVKKDLGQGKSLGITGTPTTFVNGYTLNGAVSYESLSELIQTQIDAQEKKNTSDAGTKPHASRESKDQVAGR